MLLPHEACTLRPVTFCVMSVFHVTSTHRVTAGAAIGCPMRELYSMDCVTTAWLMVLSHKGSLILHCVTVAAATPSLHTQSWKRFLPGVGVWTAWRLRDWCCVTDVTDVTCTEAHEWGEWTRKCGYRTAWQLYCLDCVTGGAVAELGLSDQSAWQLRGWCCGHARPAHPVLHTIYIVKCQAFVANALRLR